LLHSCLHLFVGSCRLIFEDQGIQYEDLRTTKEEWPEIKSKMVEKGDNPYGQLPVVYFKGKCLFHTYAIIRYFAALLGLFLVYPFFSFLFFSFLFFSFRHHLSHHHLSSFLFGLFPSIDLNGANPEEEYRINNLFECFQDLVKDLSINVYAGNEETKAAFWKERFSLKARALIFLVTRFP